MMTLPDTHLHKLNDGRTLAYCDYGDPAGNPIFYAFGGPSSRLEGYSFDPAARKHGFRLIATDRPGIGQSTFKPGRVLLDYPRDISELADVLGIDQFGVLAQSLLLHISKVVWSGFGKLRQDYKLRLQRENLTYLLLWHLVQMEPISLAVQGGLLGDSLKCGRLNTLSSSK